MSDKMTLDQVDWKKVLTGLGIALVGAAMTYISGWITGVDFGAWTPLVVAGWSAITNLVRKFLVIT
ncbi:hypothetical protein HZB93_02065 [Candidatus Falkowbacteria bacterium]|nr:hypothetical protein [Candidatus Falkowbacteria bacterium]